VTDSRQVAETADPRPTSSPKLLVTQCSQEGGKGCSQGLPANRRIVPIIGSESQSVS
jgi:hypothetical protein